MAEAGFMRLDSKLDTLARRGAAYLSRWVLGRAVESALPGLYTATLIVPAAFLLASLLTLATGASIWPFARLSTLLLFVAVPLTVFAGHVLLAFVVQRVDRRMSLALFDRELGCRDRIQAADEFLRDGTPTRFQLAAIHDACRYVDRALDAKLAPLQVAGPKWRMADGRRGMLALSLLLVAMLIDSRVPDASGDGERGYVAPVNAAAPTAPTPDAGAPPVPEETQDGPADVALPAARTTAADDGESASPVEASHRPSAAGIRAAGSRSAAGDVASQEARTGSANSSASGEAAAARRPERPHAAAGRRPKDGQPPPDGMFDENNESSSGITGGKGSGGGSRTASSDRRTAANRAQQDESAEANYDDAEEEEDEEQQAAAAARPLLSQRKAPVDRSLTPSVESGNENPRMNGRGGPGGLKKTRGVAAMLLGAPLPDQLRGRANPGRMKVQRERAEPEEKRGGDVAAVDRGRIDGSTGSLAHQSLLPWMQDLVRDYFLAERGQNTTTRE